MIFLACPGLTKKSAVFSLMGELYSDTGSSSLLLSTVSPKQSAFIDIVKVPKAHELGYFPPKVSDYSNSVSAGQVRIVLNMNKRIERNIGLNVIMDDSSFFAVFLPLEYYLYYRRV